MRWRPSSLLTVGIALAALAACPNPDKRTTLWLNFGPSGLALVDHEPPPY